MSKFKGKPIKSTTSFQEVMDDAQEVFDIPDRGISVDTVKHFGLRRLMDVVNNRVDAYFMPVTKLVQGESKITGYIKYSPHRSKKGS